MPITGATWWEGFQRRRRRVYQSPLLLIFAISMVGVLMGMGLPDGIPWFALAILSSIAWFAFCYVRRDRYAWIAILIAILPLAAWRYRVQEKTLLRDQLHAIATDTWSPVVIEAVIESTPHWRPDLLRLADSPAQSDLSSNDAWETLIEMRVKGIRDNREWKRAEFGRMQVAIQGRLRHLLPGDRVEGMIDWQRIAPPTNPGQYDLASKYRRLGILVRGRTDNATQIRKLDGTSPWRLDRWLSRIVVAADIAFHRYVPYGQASLASALVLGQREQVEWEMQESLLATGTIHMLAISGMHIEMVALSVVVFCLLLRIPRRALLLITMMMVVAYALLCGGNPPVARAAVLVVALGIARWTGKTTNSLNLLGFAALTVLLYRPSDWLEIGTQLSFLAVCVLILLNRHRSENTVRHDRLDDLMTSSRHPIHKAGISLVIVCRQLLATSFCVWLLTAPLVFFRFNVVSPIAVLLNLVLWLPMLLALLSGLGLLVVGPIVPLLSYPLGWVCGANLWLTEKIVQASVDIPLSHFWLPAPSGWWALIFYLAILALIGLFGFSGRSRRSIVLFACSWLMIGILPALDRQTLQWLPGNRVHSNEQLEITFVDVGHGTCVLIQTPSGETWLYDAGRLGDAQRSHLGIAGVLWKNRISKIDRLFLSHSDSDHFNAIAGLSRRFAIKKFITTQHTLNNQSRSLRITLDQLRQQRVPFELCQAGDWIATEEVRVRFLHPPSEGLAGNDNSKSLCLLIEYAGRSILLPGDLEGEGTKKLLSNPMRPISLLMAPHHGSLSEDPSPILEWCQPKFTVVSGGSRTKNPLVRQVYSADDREVFITALDHAIRFTILRTGEMRLECWQHPNWVAKPIK